MCTEPKHAGRTESALGCDVERAFADHRERFLSFLQRRVGDRALAEDLLQAALGRALEKGVPAESVEHALNWLYRVLANAVTDHFRSRGAERRALENEALDHGDRVLEPHLRAPVCGCLHDVLPRLKPEYAAIVQQVDLEERSVSDFARASGITANNASVRLHRARAALRDGLESTCGSCAEFGCLECSCGRSAMLVYDA